MKTKLNKCIQISLVYEETPMKGNLSPLSPFNENSISNIRIEIIEIVIRKALLTKLKLNFCCEIIISESM